MTIAAKIGRLKLGWEILSLEENSKIRDWREALFLFHSFTPTDQRSANVNERTDDESENEVWKQEKISSGPGLLSSLSIYRSESEGEEEGELLTQEHNAFREIESSNADSY